MLLDMCKTPKGPGLEIKLDVKLNVRNGKKKLALLFSSCYTLFY